MVKHFCILQLGSNLGNRLENLQTAIACIASECGDIQKIGSVYSTQAWGNENQPDFYNQLISIKTIFTPKILLKKLLSIEKKMGRVRSQKWDARTIDLDILFYDAISIKSSELTIPHPEIIRRKFVLIPMLKLYPKMIHPVYKKNMQELLTNCTDNLEVKPI